MRDDFWLKRVALVVHQALRMRKTGTALRVLPVRQVTESDTGGWMVSVGRLGDVWLDLWLDRYACPDRRLFYAGFYSDEAAVIKRLVQASRRKWPAVLTLGSADVEERRYAHLKRPLPAGKLNAPVAEHYEDEESHHYFGFYERMKGTPAQIEARFTRQAVDFFMDVIRQLPGSTEDDEQAEVFPQIENRRLVRSHLIRERSRFLAAQCKERDGYECQVCGMSFARVYGQQLGKDFAEAHHKRPLSHLGGQVKTRLEDLITVCANCHRMLHRMDGKPGDIGKLKALVRKNRQKH
ncbi:MAG: HNH endonuclease [Verrucomicrobiaceae bacterium]|jgi:5-methylcytosine-specific restriction endonuclease McrA|nr:HNH endonuclease [Verrucomicrobiaceae bacterium]